MYMWGTCPIAVAAQLQPLKPSTPQRSASNRGRSVTGLHSHAFAMTKLIRSSRASTINSVMNKHPLAVRSSDLGDARSSGLAAAYLRSNTLTTASSGWSYTDTQRAAMSIHEPRYRQILSCGTTVLEEIDKFSPRSNPVFLLSTPVPLSLPTLGPISLWSIPQSGTPGVC